MPKIQQILTKISEIRTNIQFILENRVNNHYYKP